MAGRIRDEDVAAVRERARLEDVVRDHLALRPAGGGSLKGLCPFHEERSPSFTVSPAKQVWYCFGCGEGGDTIGFVEKIENLSFAEAVEQLAARAGVQLRYEQGGLGRQAGQRRRLADANAAAAAWFAARLGDPEAAPGRQFLDGRGFDDAAAARFGVGYAPRGWDGLVGHLRAAGFDDRELLAAGLVAEGRRGVYDRFRGRLVWPIRDLGGDVVGFGARRLHDDDTGPKYLNTPETPLYRKSAVLFGLDLARRAISSEQRAVVVEGYTDVMACHLAGVGTAVATCGTAFGTEHVKVLRRLLMDADALRGEVVFTFDGDAAGQRAALRAFGTDQQFVALTFVAVEPAGLDPCELRQQHGDAAVRALVDARVPLVEFAVRAALRGVDLATAEGRVAGLHAAAPLVARIRDDALRPEYARLLAGWLGMPEPSVAAEVARAARSGAAGAGRPGPRGDAPAAPRARLGGPPGGPATAEQLERQACQCLLQEPGLVGPWYDAVEPSAFTVAGYAAVHAAVAAARAAAPEAAGPAWVAAVLDACPDDAVRGLVRALAVEPLPATSAVAARYVVGVLARLLERDAGRQVATVKAAAAQAVPGSPESELLVADLFALEAARRSLMEQAAGAE